MKCHIDHIGINVWDVRESKKFYNELLSYLGFKEHDGGWINKLNGIWLSQASNKDSHERTHVGVNHVSFRVQSHEDVDIFYKEFLLENNVSVLYDNPKEYPQYTKGYYAVFFEDPDKIKLEVFWFPK